MTATQMKRIRRNIAKAVELTAAADDAAKAGHADHQLRALTARAADDMSSAQRQLNMWDRTNQANAEAIARSMENDR